ncbi:MAG: ABC transporter permease, partial [Flavobacteriaceae bacterium]|nr:ABC transporter permease [Flavobacteriaceae bacterium]
MRFSSYIAKRYLISKSSNNAINIITLIAAIGVVVGAMSLFIVLSGFSGLKDFSLSFSNIFDADLKVLPKTGKHFKFNPQDETHLKEIEGIASYSKIIEERVFLSFDGKRHIAYIKGVDENYRQVTQIDSTLLVGNWFETTQPHTVIGLNISSILSLGLYDYNEALEIYVPKPGNGDILDASKAFNKKSVLVSGIYQINEDLDGKYVFSNFNLAKSLLVMPENSVTGIEIKLSPQADEASIIKNVETLFQQKVIVKNRIQQNDTLYKMLNTENLAVYLIVSLIAAIALFSIAGAIIMMILNKRKSIITYYNLGATLR